MRAQAGWWHSLVGVAAAEQALVLALRQHVTVGRVVHASETQQQCQPGCGVWRI